MPTDTPFTPKLTSGRIKNLSNRRRIPRLGKIHLGIKKIARSGKEYPSETPFFVCPPEVEKVYGKEPVELDVMFPLESPEACFPQAYEHFGSGAGLKCTGDGERAAEKQEDGTWKERACPCEKAQPPEGMKASCAQSAHLMVILPKISMGGVYQIDTHSYHSIVDVNSGIDYCIGVIGRMAWVPLKLKRVPRVTHGKGQKATHYTMAITFDANADFINTLRGDSTRILLGPGNPATALLEAPAIVNPEQDPEGPVTFEEPDIQDAQFDEKPPAPPAAADASRQQTASQPGDAPAATTKEPAAEASAKPPAPLFAEKSCADLIHYITRRRDEIGHAKVTEYVTKTFGMPVAKFKDDKPKLLELINWMDAGGT